MGSEDNAPQARPNLPELAENDVLRLLKNRGIKSLPCPACKSHEWGGFVDVAVSVIEGRDPATGEIEGVAGSIHAISMSCTQCGYMSLFDREFIGD